MSFRHQTASRPAKPDRRVQHHRERQATRVALRVSDLEEVLDPLSVHNIPVPVSPRPAEAKSRRFRHWKQPLWKRRTARRHLRNQATAHLTDQ